MLSLNGKTLSTGIAIGKPIFLELESFFEDIEIRDIDVEIKKYKMAVKKSQKQILDLKKSLLDDDLNITLQILDSHLEILLDPIIEVEIIERIKNEKKSANIVFKDILDEYNNKISDPFFKQRILDIQDVLKRITSNLRSLKVNNLKNLKSDSIIISEEIIPSDIFEIKSKNILAFISNLGSYSSHASILARAKNIPFISNVNIKKLKNKNIDMIIIDAVNSKIIINPTEKIIEKYQLLKKESIFEKKQIENQFFFDFYANISNVDEVEDILKFNLKGIGLFRTEFLFFNEQKIPDAKAQLDIYKKIAEKLDNRSFIIRLFDFGLDKKFSFDSALKDTNNRGIRFLLNNKKLLKDQISAILKASVYGNIHILIPYVKTIEEIKTTKQIIQEIKTKLKNENISFTDVKVGSMIETIEAIDNLSEIIKIVDFISLGTNDLTKSILKTSSFDSDTLHPKIEKLISYAVNISRQNKKDIFLCGEIASKKKFHHTLCSLGIKKLSIGSKIS